MKSSSKSFAFIRMGQPHSSEMSSACAQRASLSMLSVSRRLLSRHEISSASLFLLNCATKSIVDGKMPLYTVASPMRVGIFRVEPPKEERYSNRIVLVLVSIRSKKLSSGKSPFAPCLEEITLQFSEASIR